MLFSFFLLDLFSEWPTGVGQDPSYISILVSVYLRSRTTYFSQAIHSITL